MNSTVKGDNLGAILMRGATVVDNNKGYREELEKKAKSLGKKVSELTEEEKEDARETFMAGHGLCDLDFLIP